MSNNPNPSWLHTLDCCDSTNTWALEHLDQLDHGSCVWTQNQGAGRGQAGRSWVSDAGVLTASFIIKPQQEPDVTRLSLCAGLAVAHCVEDQLSGDKGNKGNRGDRIANIKIKWPNDCFVHGRKIAGILCEGKRHNKQSYMVIGIGLNVNPQWAADVHTQTNSAPTASYFNGRPPISIAELGAIPEMTTLIKSLQKYLLESAAMIENNRWPAIITALQDRDCLIGQSIEIHKTENSIIGIAAGIDDNGALLIRLPDGGCMTCTSSHNLRILDVTHE